MSSSTFDTLQAAREPAMGDQDPLGNQPRNLGRCSGDRLPQRNLTRLHPPSAARTTATLWRGVRTARRTGGQSAGYRR